MNTPSLIPAAGSQVRCWCGHAPLEDWSPDYGRCPECQTLVLREMRGEEISQVRDDDRDFYGKNYYLRHVQEDYGLPDLETRARADLPERCLHWLRTLLKFVPGTHARTLELGCGHGGFVAMQRWAGLDATGLELSPWLVQQAHAWFDVPVLQGRLEDQGLAPASFDAVILMDVLEHLPDPRRTLGQAVALLRSPESFLLIQTPCYPAGWTCEALREHDHPFLTQLKPTEHLYLFSEQAVARLCAELGVGQVRFEPAIFAHYDLFAVASAGPLPERPLPERTAMLLAASPPARWTLAMLDLGEVRDDLEVRLVESSAEARGLRETAEAQGAEITRLHAEVDRWLHENRELWPKFNAAENARNLAVAQLADLQRQFAGLESDSAARLQVIERQGAELARLHAEADQLWPKLEAALHERNLAAAQMADLRGHFEQSEADRDARLQLIETQGAEIARLHAEVDHWLHETGELRPRLEAAEHERNLRAAQLADWQRQFAGLEADHAARLQIIEEHGDELGELRAQLSLTQGELAALHDHYQASEADRAARLQLIETQGRDLGELRAQLSLIQSELDALRGHHQASEADRAARLQLIERQGDELGELRARLSLTRSELDALHGHHQASEADRAARLQLIETQGRDLGELRAQLSFTQGELDALHDHYQASEADRAARLAVIEEQGANIGWLQTRLAANEALRAQTAADLDTTRAAHDALVGERARLAADVDQMNAAHAALATEHGALRARHKTLNQHWTTWVLKKLRLWPL